jgi:hypothetical protein
MIKKITLVIEYLRKLIHYIQIIILNTTQTQNTLIWVG